MFHTSRDDSAYASKDSTPTITPVGFGDCASVSEYDENITDMISKDLYTADWELVGTEPPSENVEGWFDMKFVQSMYMDGDSTPTDRRFRRPLKINVVDDVVCELLPFSSKSLGMYYSYFASYVNRGIKGSMLMCLCQEMFKSPVFDIPGCTLVKPKTDRYDKSMFVTVDIGDCNAIIFVPVTAFDAITDALYGVDVRVMPTYQDTWSYSSCRATPSAYMMYSDIPKSSWKGSAYTAEFARRVECSAVATATLTVSVLLEPWQYARGKHTSKYNLRYIIHSIK